MTLNGPDPNAGGGLAPATSDTMPYPCGFLKTEVWDAVDQARMPVMVFYPTTKPERLEQLGPFELEIARDAVPAGGAFPLILISHGSGGAPLLYRTLAQGLARLGFVVGAPEHPFNNRSDNSRANTPGLLAARPRHLRAVADWFFDRSPLAGMLTPGAYAVVGHSIGGHTALAVAGGRSTAQPGDTPGGYPLTAPAEADPRVKAVVLLAPALIAFRSPGSLKHVRVPMLLLLAEHDRVFPAGYADLVVRATLADVPDPAQVEHRIVPGAGHFAFMSAYPPAMRQRSFPPSQDPPGFDRDLFQRALLVEVADFLRRHP